MLLTMNFTKRLYRFDTKRCLLPCFVLLVTAVVLTKLYHRPTLGMSPEPPSRFQLDFIPKNVQICEDIPLNEPMSWRYVLMMHEFEEAVKKAKGGGGIEGFSAQVPGQYHIMHYLAGQKAARTICETGFNLGHSSFNYLTANDRAIVHSFDLGNHHYSSIMSRFLAEKFPNRLFVHFGDSMKTVPEFIRSNPGFQCDFILVDGGHVYAAALADLRNFAMVANLEENIIILDDHPTDWSKDFGASWEEVKSEGIVSEITRCTFRDIVGTQRGFTLGRVINRPRENATVSKP